MEIKTDTNEKQKIIFDHIPINRSYEKDKIIETVFTHKVEPKIIEELIISTPDSLKFAEKVRRNTANTRSNFSKQQLDFTYDVAKLITGQLIENKPTLIPVKCGFGKSTVINTLILTKIQQFLEDKNTDIGMILVTERINDLKEVQRLVHSKFGFYNEFQYRDKGGGLQHVTTPWVYVLESWNKDLFCRKQLQSYSESLEKCPKCEFYSDCKLGRQIDEQYFSPIIAITSPRLFYYLENETLDRIQNWREKGKNGKERIRKLLLIDEKPKLTKINDVSEREIRNLIDVVERIDAFDSDVIRKDKARLKEELENIGSQIRNIVEEFKKYRNAYVKLNQSVFSEQFYDLWEKYLKFKSRDTLDNIQNMFNNGAIFCRTGKYDLFKTISMAKFDVSEFKTFIFDGTAELSLEYDEEDFNLLKVNDYREYSNVKFHLVEGNFSKSILNKSTTKLDPVCEWINININSKTYVVSYKMARHYLYTALQENSNIIFFNDTDGIKCVPYFGFTKGKNNWRDCDKMIQIGWNRWDSDTYIASRIATSKKIKEKFNEKYESHFDTIQRLMQNENGIFAFSDIEMYKLMQMINDFEQEVFRTRIREFTSVGKVDVYIFNCNATMKKMIEQRFTKCEFIEEKWNELEAEKKRKRKGSDSNIELMLYDWLKGWLGEDKNIGELKEKFGITDNYWKKLKKKPLIKSLWQEFNIQTRREGANYYIYYSEK